MPLDPLIVNSPKLDIGDPLGDYTNYLQATHYKTAADKARRAESENALYNEAYRQNTDAQGTVNQNGLRAFLAQKGIGTYIPDVQKGEGERAKTGAEVGHINSQTANENAQTGKVNAEAFEKTWNNYKSELSSISHDPNQGIPQLVEWTKRQFADPVMGPMLKARGQTPESAIAELTNTLKTMPFDKFLLGIQIGPEAASKQSTTTLDLAGHKQIISTPDHSFGAPKATIISDQQVTDDPNAGKNATRLTINNIPAQVESAYGKEFAQLMAKEDIGLYQAAQKAPQLAQRADRIAALLDSSNIITGPAATQRAQIAAVLGLKGGAETQVLGSELARNTLDAIGPSGLGGGNGFTDKDREFLQKAVGGQLELDKKALREITRLNRKAAQGSVDRWNTRVQQIKTSATSGTGTPTSPVQLPQAPGQSYPVPPKANIDRLRANPSERAIFEKHYGPGSAARYLGK